MTDNIDSDADIIARWHLSCQQWGRMSRGGYPGKLRRRDADEGGSEAVWQHVESALCALGRTNRHRTIVRDYYLQPQMVESARCYESLAKMCVEMFPEFNRRDGMTDEQRARRWLDLALLELEMRSPLPRSG